MDLRFASAAGRAVAATGVDFPVQSLEDAGWEGRHDAIAIGALENDARGKPSGLTRRW